MKRIIAVAALVLVAASAQATTYAWVSTSTANTVYWDSSSNWSSSGGTYPSTTSDNAIVGTGGRCTIKTGVTYTTGGLYVTNGSVRWQAGTPKMVIAGDAYLDPTSGSWSSAGYGMSFDVGGNFYWGSSGLAALDDVKLLQLRGTAHATNIVDRNAGGSAYLGAVTACEISGAYTVNTIGAGGMRNPMFWTLRVKNGGNLLGTNANGAWAMRRLIVETGGTIGGGDFQFMAGVGDNIATPTPALGAANLVLPGGVTLPNVVGMGVGYNSRAKYGYYVWKMDGGGDLISRKNLDVSHVYAIAGYSPTMICDLTDNASGASRSATVGNDLVVGTPGTATSAYADSILRGAPGVSTIKIGGTVWVGPSWSNVNNYNQRNSATYTEANGAIDMGNATIRFGGNWWVNRRDNNIPSAWFAANWKQGTSTVIADGNGTFGASHTQVLYTDNAPFNNFIVRTRGTVQLGGANVESQNRDLLVIRGNLRLENGTFNDMGRAIYFNGPGHTLFWDNANCAVAGNMLDNVILVANAVVTLDAGSGTAIKLDNLDMTQSGTKIYLNGVTLQTWNHTWVSSQTDVNGVAYQNGFIFGTPVPEPATLATLGSASLAAIAWLRRRRMR